MSRRSGLFGRLLGTQNPQPEDLATPAPQSTGDLREGWNQFEIRMQPTVVVGLPNTPVTADQAPPRLTVRQQPQTFMATSVSFQSFLPRSSIVPTSDGADWTFDYLTRLRNTVTAHIGLKLEDVVLTEEPNANDDSVTYRLRLVSLGETTVTVPGALARSAHYSTAERLIVAADDIIGVASGLQKSTVTLETVEAPKPVKRAVSLEGLKR